jgi:hypothetical protein
MLMQIVNRRHGLSAALALTLAAFAACLFGGRVSLAQPPKVGQSATVKANPRKRGAGDAKSPEIKDAEKKGNPATRKNRPAAKGGDAKRAALPVFHIDNRTDQYIDIYLDGYFEGTVGPYGDMYRYVDVGSHRVYAQGDEGGEWGPAVYRVGSRGYSLRLTD